MKTWTDTLILNATTITITIGGTGLPPPPNNQCNREGITDTTAVGESTSWKSATPPITAPKAARPW